MPPPAFEEASMTMPDEAAGPAGTRDDQFVARIAAFCRALAGKSAATEGERASWEALFCEHSTATRRVAEKVGLRGPDVDDCHQEAWTDIFLQLAAGRYDPDRGRLSSWIYTVVRHKAVDILRASRGRAPSKIDNPDLLPTGREDDPAVAYDRKRESQLLHEALETLLGRVSPATFQTLYGFWIDEKDCGQIAQELGLTPEQIRYRRRRAKQFLHELLAHRLDVDEDARTSLRIRKISAR